MIDYKGPKTLQRTVNKLVNSMPSGLSRENPKITIGIEHLDVEYDTLGFDSEGDYFEAIDGIVKELDRLKRMNTQAFNKHFDSIKKEDYDNPMDYMEAIMTSNEEQTRIEEERINQFIRLTAIGDGNEIHRNQIFSNTTIGDITLEEISKLGADTNGAYSSMEDIMFFDPSYIHNARGKYNSAVRKTIIHELTHRELGDTQYARDIRGAYSRLVEIDAELNILGNSEAGQQIEALPESKEFSDLVEAYQNNDPNKLKLSENLGLSQDQTDFFEKVHQLSEEYESHYETIKSMRIQRKKLKMASVDEGLAHATAKEEPSFSEYANEHESIEDYEEAFSVFKSLLKKRGYSSTVQLAVKVINDAYTENTNALVLLNKYAQVTNN